MSNELRPSAAPPVSSGLYSWVDFQDPSTMTFSSGKISAQSDKSGNAFDWQQTTAANRLTFDQNLLEGRGGVTFDFKTGVGLLSVNPASGINLNDFTYFFVGKRTGQKLSSVWQDFGSGNTFGPSNYNNRYGIGQNARTLEGLPSDKLAVMGLKNTGSSSTSFFFDHSNKKFLSIDGNFPSSGSAMGNLSLGGKNFGANNGYTAIAAGFLLYSRALNDDEIADTNNWLRSYYRIPDLYESKDLLIVFSGDSITVGGNIDEGPIYPEIAMASLGLENDDFLVSAIGGQNVIQADTTDALLVDSLPKSKSKNIIILLIGANDLAASASPDLVAFQNNLMKYCINRRDSGYNKIFICTILPRTGGLNAGFNGDRGTINTWMRASWSEYADGLIDIASDLFMGPDSADTNTALYGDGVHPTAMGNRLLAPYFAEKIREHLIT